MKALLVLLLALPAPAQMRVVETPAGVPTAGPSFAPAALGGLTGLGGDLSAATLRGTDVAPTLDAAFHGSVPLAASTPEVEGKPSIKAAKPALEPNHAASFKTVERPPVAKAVWESAETGMTMVPFAVAALVLKGNVHEPAVLVPSMLALWAAAYWAMVKTLGGLRSVVVGGWQASHDQRYRVDTNTGNLKDVRGHKYGEDRYEEMRDGEVAWRAKTAMALAAALAAAAFLLS